MVPVELDGVPVGGIPVDDLLPDPGKVPE
jgi:hypothetical protein